MNTHIHDGVTFYIFTVGFYRLALKAIFIHRFTLIDLKSAQIFTRIFFALLRQPLCG